MSDVVKPAGLLRTPAAKVGMVLLLLLVMQVPLLMVRA